MRAIWRRNPLQGREYRIVLLGGLAAFMVFAHGIPGMAAVAPASDTRIEASLPARIDLDLSSTVSNLSAAFLVDGKSARIRVGGRPQLVTANTRVTPAELVAVRQVIDGGWQALRIGARGNAVGGSLVLPASRPWNLGSLVIPHGVTVINAAPLLTLDGRLYNAGRLFAVPAEPGVRDANITAETIVNHPDGLITSLPAMGGLPGSTQGPANLNLHVAATDDMINSGAISSAGKLVVSVGGAIKNRTMATLRAADDVDLESHTGAFFNGGLIASKSASINLSTASAITDIVLENEGGSLQAKRGAIDIRDRIFADARNTTLSGGDFISKEFNLYSGCGAVSAGIQNATGAVNVAAGAIQMAANGRVLHVNHLDVTGDPILVNSGGDIDLDTMAPTHGNEFVAVASGDIFSSSGAISIDTSSSIGAGGTVILIAGARATVGAQSTVIKGRSRTGGNINLGNLSSSSLNTRSSANGAPGGAVTLVAFAKKPGSSKGGHITLPAGLAVETGGQGDADSGKIVIIGEAKSSRAWPVTIQTGALNTTGSSKAAMILVETATPASATWPVTIEGSYARQEQASNGTVVSGMFQFGTLREGAISTGVLSAANAGGAVILLGGSNAAGGPAISTQAISNSGSTGSGRVVLMAGAAAPQTHGNGFDIATGAIDTHSATVVPDNAQQPFPVQPGYPVTVITPGAISVAGSIDTSNKSAFTGLVPPTDGGGGEITLVAGSKFKPGGGITVQGGVNSSSTASYSASQLQAEGLPQGVGSATITLVGLGKRSDIKVTNPRGPAIYTAAPGANSGSGAVVVATPGAITFQNNGPDSQDVIDTSGSSVNTYGSQVILSSGQTRGDAVSILSSGVGGNILSEGKGQTGDGAVWVLTAGGAYTPGYTVNGKANPNNFTDLPASRAIGPGEALTIQFQPGSRPKGYCPGGYHAISDGPDQPTRIKIVGKGNTQPLEVPMLVRGAAGINLKNSESFIKGTYKNGTLSTPSTTMKLFSAGPIVAPIGNSTPGQTLGLNNAISTTGNIRISFVSSPVNLFNTIATPGTLSLNSKTTLTSFGQMLAGKSIDVRAPNGSNVGFALSPVTGWECFNLASEIAISASGSGSINLEGGAVHCGKLVLESQSGDIFSRLPSPLGVSAARVRFNTTGEVDIRDNWPGVLLPSSGNPAQFTGVSTSPGGDAN